MKETEGDQPGVQLFETGSSWSVELVEQHLMLRLCMLRFSIKEESNWDCTDSVKDAQRREKEGSFGLPKTGWS